MYVICLPRRWKMRWGLKECLLALKRHPLKSAADGDAHAYHESFYVATHIGYAISAYNSVQAPIQRMVPWLDKYIRHSFRDLMKRWEKKEGSAPETYVDIDGVGECVDTFRGMGATPHDPGAWLVQMLCLRCLGLRCYVLAPGLTEASDPYCCEGSAYLLRVQNKNGSFPAWFEVGQSATTFYDKLHSTWVCTQALRDRDFQIIRNAAWLGHAEKLLRQTDFGKLDYKPNWK